jgi:hypothetical protein
MNRAWFPIPRESDPLLRYDTADNNFRERGMSPRDKIWATIIECGMLGGIVLTFIIKVIW